MNHCIIWFYNVRKPFNVQIQGNILFCEFNPKDFSLI